MSAIIELRFSQSGYAQSVKMPHVPNQPLRVYLRQHHLIAQRLSQRMINFKTREPLRLAYIPKPDDIISLQAPTA